MSRHSLAGGALDPRTTAIIEQIESCGYIVEMALHSDGVCIGAIDAIDPAGTPWRYVKIDDTQVNAEYSAAGLLAHAIGIDL